MSSEVRHSLHSLQRRVLVAGAWAVGAKVATVTITLVFNVLIARTLPAAEVGLFFVLSSLVYVAGTVATLGINSSLLRSLASDGRNGPIVGLSRAWRLVTTASLFTALLGGVLLSIADDSESIRDPLVIAALCAIWIPAQALTLLLSDTFRGLHDVRLASFFEGTQGGLLPAFMATVLLLIFPTGPLHSIAALVAMVVVLTVLNLALGLGILAVRWSRHSRRSTEAHETPSTRVLVLHSLPFLATTLFLLLRTQIGLWIVGAFGSPEDAAVFGICLRVMNAVMLPSMVVTNALQPTVAHLMTSPDRAQIEPLLRRMATLTTLPVVAAMIVLQVAGATLLGRIFGPEYAAGATVLQVLALGNLLFSWCGSPGLILSMSGRQRTNMFIYGLTAIFTAVLGIPAMLRFGMVGVAAVIGGVGLVNKLLTMWVANREFGIRTHVTFDLLPSRAPVTD